MSGRLRERTVAGDDHWRLHRISEGHVLRAMASRLSRSATRRCLAQKQLLLLRGRHSIRGSSSSTRRRRASIPKPSCSFATRLRVLVAGRTTIAVAHRLSTIQLHDPGHGPKPRVPQGQLRGAGTHQELLAEHGIYFKLFEPQYKSANLVSKSA